MSEMKLWATKNVSRNCVGTALFRGDVAPELTEGGYYSDGKTNAIAYNDSISAFVGSDLKPGQCREIKTLDLINWTVEYVPDPPTLKEAWKAYWEGGVSYRNGSVYGNLIEALQREFPDE